MNHDTTILILVLLAIGTGLFSDLIAFSMGDPSRPDDFGRVAQGRILSWLGYRLLDRYEKEEHDIMMRRERREEAHVERMLKLHIKEYYNDLPEEVRTPPPYNPVNWAKLFICPTCFNVWLSAAAFAAATGAMVFYAAASPWWFAAIVPFIGVSNLALAIAGMVRHSK